MDEDKFNMSVRKFLKKMGITSQREIERYVHEGLASGQLKEGGRLTVHAVVSIDGAGEIAKIDDQITLE